MNSFLLWSWKHDAWWGPDERGYVRTWRDAGRYPLDRCVQICLRSNTTGFNTGIVPLGAVIPDREEAPWRGRRAETEPLGARQHLEAVLGAISNWVDVGSADSETVRLVDEARSYLRLVGEQEAAVARDGASDQADIVRAFAPGVDNRVINAVERARSLKIAAGQASPDYDIGYQSAKRDVLIELAKEFAAT